MPGHSLDFPSVSSAADAVFRDAVHTYTADGCLPLRAAADAGELQVSALARGHYPGRSLAGNTLAGVSSIGYWDARHIQNWGLSWHRNEGIEINYLERGAIDFAVPSRQFQLKAGDIAITRPWGLHRLGGSHMGPNRLHWLILDVGVRSQEQNWAWPTWLVLSGNEKDQLKNNLGRAHGRVWNSNVEVRQCFDSMGQLVHKDELNRNLSRLAVRINDLLLSLLDLHATNDRNAQPPESHCAVRLLLERLSKNPESLAAEWTVERMAVECGLKATQFAELVKEITNVAPMQYLNSCRLAHARTLLRNHRSMSITEIAFECGFASSQYFATLFRQHFEQTPTDFRTCTDC